MIRLHGSPRAIGAMDATYAGPRKQHDHSRCGRRAFDFEPWKPWLHKVNQTCNLQIPEMPLLQTHLTDHVQPPKHRRIPPCRRIAVLQDPSSTMRSGVTLVHRLRYGKSGTDSASLIHGGRIWSRNGTMSNAAQRRTTPKYTWEWYSRYVLRKTAK
jgi:hypothetical protein